MRWTASIALVALVSSTVHAEPRPTLDDFYQRTRSRAEGFEECTGFCNGDHLAGFLIGGQIANPSTDAVQQGFADGARFGVDLGAFYSRYSVVRTRAWADVLRVESTGDSVTDLAWDTTLFHALGEPDVGGLHLSLNTLLAERTELEPDDFAELQLAPYRLGDVEVELSPHGPKVDKDAFIALPIGAQMRRRLDTDGELVERRDAVAAALAFRGFLKTLRNHYQLDALRVKRTMWETDAGEVDAWSVSAGYQRLSPDVEWLELWLLAGYGWYEQRKGWIAQLGAEMHFETDAGEVWLGPKYDAHFVLDRRNNRFSRVHDARIYYRHRLGPTLPGIAYQVVSVDDTATLHALTPQLGVTVLGLEATARYRLAFVRDDRFEGAPAEERYQVSVDWLF